MKIPTMRQEHSTAHIRSTFLRRAGASVFNHQRNMSLRENYSSDEDLQHCSHGRTVAQSRKSEVI